MNSTAGSHRPCYDGLQHGGLPPKLKQARLTVQDALASPFARDRLAQGLADPRNLPPGEADAQAERMPQQHDRGLDGVRTKAPDDGQSRPRLQSGLGAPAKYVRPAGRTKEKARCQAAAGLGDNAIN